MCSLHAVRLLHHETAFPWPRHRSRKPVDGVGANPPEPSGSFRLSSAGMRLPQNGLRLVVVESIQSRQPSPLLYQCEFGKGHPQIATIVAKRKVLVNVTNSNHDYRGRSAGASSFALYRWIKNCSPSPTHTGFVFKPCTYAF